MRRSDLIKPFMDNHGWYSIPYNRGEFTVSPDNGAIRRFFSADIKYKKDAIVLLGVFGIMYQEVKNDKVCNFEISAYITNFDEFSSPIYITSKSTLDEWADNIVNQVIKLPLDEEEIKKDFSNNKIGPFELRIFEESSIKADDFIKNLPSQ